jgi:type IV pilus assembly protein PilX
MSNRYNRRAQRGMVLIASLLLLVVVTILGLSMFRSFGLEEKIAGNMREKQRALHAAETAQQYAEHWLSQTSTIVSTTCTELLNANLGQGQICADPLATQNNHALIAGSAWPQLGVSYNPTDSNGAPLMKLTADAPGTPDTYYQTPQFYIYDVGGSADG